MNDSISQKYPETLNHSDHYYDYDRNGRLKQVKIKDDEALEIGIDFTKTDEELLEEIAKKISQILKISYHNIDKTRFVYFYTLLYAQLGGDDKNMQHWMNTYNNHLEFCPVERLTDKISFDKMIRYLESFQ